MTKISVTLLALASAMVASSAAFAGPLNPITGSISISGNDIDTFNASKITFTGKGTATGTGGSLAGVDGSVNLASFTYANSNNVELFNVTTGPDEPVTFTIDGSVDLLVDLPGVVVFTGEGWLTEAGGFTPTLADFTLSSSGSGTATSLEITSDGGGLRATGVFLEHDSQSLETMDRYYVRARREIILCGGAIGSPQLLMLR